MPSWTTTPKPLNVDPFPMFDCIFSKHVNRAYPLLEAQEFVLGTTFGAPLLWTQLVFLVQWPCPVSEQNVLHLGSHVEWLGFMKAIHPFLNVSVTLKTSEKVCHKYGLLLVVPLKVLRRLWTSALWLVFPKMWLYYGTWSYCIPNKHF